MKVSSEKMCEASPRFRAMLTGPWLEATTIHTDGLRRVETEGFDHEVFLAVIKIIHDHKQETLSLPEIIDLEFVAKIAVVVDDLDCYPFVDDLGFYLYREAVFTRSMRMWSYQVPPLTFDREIYENGIQRSEGPIPTLGLPRPDVRVVGNIEKMRRRCIKKLLSAARTMVREVRADNFACSQHSRSVLYASSAYQALNTDVNELHDPYYGVSVKELDEYTEEGLRTDAPIVNCFNRECPVNVCLRACGTAMMNIRLGFL
ncbi:hypothetical protein GE09DRAFT_1258498 [Coniochaeta sp. 2T2.1]|nr:hypothetical protein GE09DRAFT_1258498 [Coniochaeta sp. 2T2.1]